LRSKDNGHQKISHVLRHLLLVPQQHVVGVGDHVQGLGLGQRARVLAQQLRRAGGVALPVRVQLALI